MTQPNPLMAPGVRVRCVDHRNCPEMIIEGREYFLRAVASDQPYVMTTEIPAWLHASRFRPVVRRKMGRRVLGRGVPDPARPGDVVQHADGTRYANVYVDRDMLKLSPWWSGPQ